MVTSSASVPSHPSPPMTPWQPAGHLEAARHLGGGDDTALPRTSSSTQRNTITRKGT